jgi:hypothetical protein
VNGRLIFFALINPPAPLECRAMQLFASNRHKGQNSVSHSAGNRYALAPCARRPAALNVEPPRSNVQQRRQSTQRVAILAFDVRRSAFDVQRFLLSSASPKRSAP